MYLHKCLRVRKDTYICIDRNSDFEEIDLKDSPDGEDIYIHI
jgi:hypothetical protein